MSFTSVIFVFFFLPIVLVAYWITPEKFRNLLLTLASFVFIAWGGGEYAFILGGLIVVNYVCGLGLLCRGQRLRRVIFLLGIGANLLPLCYFKYFNFLTENVNLLFGTAFAARDLILPLGVSFYVFQGISYLFDVYRNDAKPEKNFINLACYLALFIKVTQGPIEKYTDFCPQIRGRRFTAAGFSYGIQRFSIGMGKKILIADTLGVLVDKIWDNMGYIGIDSPTAWLGAFAYMFQLYFDFSGYSDMAIGIGEMFGFHLQENFNYPYISKSITEFWRRWHISLSTWFKNYLYIPLGGNRRGNVYVNLAVVFLATGIWHGANYTFLIWGIWQGIFMLIERKLMKADLKFKAPGALKWIVTMFLILIGWIIFRAPSLESAGAYLQYMFGIKQARDLQFTFAYYVDRKIIVMLLISLAAMTPALTAYLKKKKEMVAWAAAGMVYTTGILVLSIMAMINSTYSPFLYFQF